MGGIGIVSHLVLRRMYLNWSYFNQDFSGLQMGVDRYGRTVGRLYIKEMSIDAHLVESGSCWVYPRYAKDSHAG